MHLVSFPSDSQNRRKAFLPTFFFLEFPVRFLTVEGFSSNGSIEIFNNGTYAWEYLCVENWDDVERTLVCQAQGFNGSSLEVHSKSGTNSSRHTINSCEQLTQTCEEKINTEIKCSGINTFLYPQNESWVTSNKSNKNKDLL